MFSNAFDMKSLKQGYGFQSVRLFLQERTAGCTRNILESFDINLTPLAGIQGGVCVVLRSHQHGEQRLQDDMTLFLA